MRLQITQKYPFFEVHKITIYFEQNFKMQNMQRSLKTEGAFFSKN